MYYQLPTNECVEKIKWKKERGPVLPEGQEKIARTKGKEGSDGCWAACCSVWPEFVFHQALFLYKCLCWRYGRVVEFYMVPGIVGGVLSIGILYLAYLPTYKLSYIPTVRINLVALFNFKLAAAATATASLTRYEIEWSIWMVAKRRFGCIYKSASEVSFSILSFSLSLSFYHAHIFWYLSFSVWSECLFLWRGNNRMHLPTDPGFYIFFCSKL